MLSRRQMIGSAAAITALGGSVGAPRAALSSTIASPRVSVVLLDERFEAALSLSRALAAPGVPRVALSRDVLESWHRHVAPLCAAGKSAFGGVTTERGFFLLRTLAADHRLRVRSRTTQGALVSWVIGPR